LAFQLPLALQPLSPRASSSGFGGIMYLKEGYSDRVVQKVEDLASRVHLLKGRLARQKVSVRLERYWELANVRSLFAEFKWRVEQLTKTTICSWNGTKRPLTLPGTT